MIIKTLTTTIFALSLFSCGVEEKVQDQGFQSVDAEAFTQTLNELGLTDDGIDIEAQETNSTGLSDEAKRILEAVKVIKQEVGSQLQEICAWDAELRQKVKDALRVIFNDDTLSEEEKRQAASDLKDRYLSAIQDDRAQRRACIAENEDLWNRTKAQFTPIKEACLLERKHWNRENRKPTRRQVVRRIIRDGEEVRDDLIAKLEVKLTSEDCSLAIEGYTSSQP